VLSIILALSVSVIFLSDNAQAVRGYKERDYISDRSIREKGITPKPGRRYTLSQKDSKWPEQATFSMNKAMSFLVEIEPVKRQTGVVFLASQAFSPNIMKAVWAHDDLRSSIRFWTSDYFRPEGNCTYSGCPRIRFQATEGTVAIKILEVRKSSKAYIK